MLHDPHEVLAQREIGKSTIRASRALAKGLKQKAMKDESLNLLVLAIYNVIRRKGISIDSEIEKDMETLIAEGCLSLESGHRDSDKIFKVVNKQK